MSVAQPLRLVGRSEELAGLSALLDAALDGTGGAALVEGEAGIGKTRLLAEVLDRARERGFAILHGTAGDLQSNWPFGVFAGALARPEAPAGGQHAAVVSRLPELLGPDRADDADQEFRVIEALVGALEELAALVPTLLVLEDLHWADPSSLRAARAVANRLTGLPLVVIAAFRPTPRVRELDELTADLLNGHARLLALGPLDDDATSALTRQITGSPPSDRLHEQLRRCGGNALFVIELLRALGDEGALTTRDGRTDTPRARTPESLRIVVVRRLRLLPVPTLDLLKIASVLGTSFALAELAGLTGRPASRLLAPLDDAIRASLVGEAGDRLAFRHPMIREAIYLELPESARKALHRDAASALMGLGAPAVQVAEHLFLGANPGDAEAVTWLRKAAHDARARSARVAVDLLERALELVPADWPEREQMLAELAPLLALVGRYDEADARIAEVLAGRPEPIVQMRLRVGLAQTLVRRGRWQSAAEQIRAGAEPLTDPDSRALALGPGTIVSLVTGDVAGAREVAQRTLAAARRAGNPVSLGTALNALSLAASCEGSLDSAIQLAQDGIAGGGQANALFAGFLFPHLCLGTALLDADRHAEADQALLEGLRLAEERGAATLLQYYQSVLAISRLQRGEWDDAVSDAESALTCCEDSGTRWSVLACGVIARVAVARDDPETARRYLDLGDAELAESGPILGASRLLWVRALLAEAEGDRAGAARVAGVAWDLLPQLRHLFGNRQFAPDLVRLALAVDDHDRAVAVTAEAHQRAERIGVTSAAASALRCQGLLAGDPDLLLRAVDLLRGGPRTFDSALASEEAAIALIGQGRGEDARPLLVEAAEGYERLGATAYQARVSAALRAVGVRQGARGPRRRPTKGWAALTPTEQTVVRLVAQGLTNPQVAQRLFISRRTVETHLKHVFGKLDLSSRAELAAEAARRA